MHSASATYNGVMLGTRRASLDLRLPGRVCLEERGEKAPSASAGHSCRTSKAGLAYMRRGSRNRSLDCLVMSFLSLEKYISSACIFSPFYVRKANSSRCLHDHVRKRGPHVAAQNNCTPILQMPLY